MRYSIKLILKTIASAAILGCAVVQAKESSQTPVVAMDAKRGIGLRSGELVTAGAENMILVNRNNFRAELSPRSVAEFDESGAFHLLRGSAEVESRAETSMRTTNAKVEFIGKVLVSFDPKETSSSVFVLAGEARLVNPHQENSTLRIAHFHGATLVVGEVIPQLVRQLDVGAVDSWLKGYSWPEASRQAILRNMPGTVISANTEVPSHLEETKIEDYFSSIDVADEQHQPDYYEKKFGDPDKVLAEQNSKKSGSKALSPEEAALISLPKTQIDLGFELGPEFLTAEQKQKEVAAVEGKPAVRRNLASVSPNSKAMKRKKNKPVVDQGDPDVSLVLERLRQVEAGKPMISGAPKAIRAPAAVSEPAVPDPVYDYSQNF